LEIKDDILLLRNFQNILFFYFSFDDGIFLDITMKYYLSPHFNFFVLQTHCHHFETCPLWVLFLKISSIFLNVILTKVYCNMDYWKIINVNVERDYTFEIYLESQETRIVIVQIIH